MSVSAFSLRAADAGVVCRVQRQSLITPCSQLFRRSAGVVRAQPFSRRPCLVYATSSAASTPAGPPGQAPRKPKNNSKVNNVPIQGTITQNLSNGKFRVKLINGVTVIAHLSGKIRKNKIKIAVGDEVTVELSAYDLTRGRIAFRH